MPRSKRSKPSPKKGKKSGRRSSGPPEKGRKGAKVRWFFILLVVAVAATALIYRDFLLPTKAIPGRLVDNHTELQIALSRNGFSPGSIDGRLGKQTQQALVAFQVAQGLDPSGEYDEKTAQLLKIEDPVFADVLLSAGDFTDITPRPLTWRERGQRDHLGYNSLLEKIAEFCHTDPDYLRELNPELIWNRLGPGDKVMVPHITDFRCASPAELIQISLSARTLKLIDAKGRILFHCPVSIARRVDKRPSGELKVTARVEDPNYTFNPTILTNAAASEGITKKFIIQPGPNNPVGSVWISLNLPSYGIHGTPEPELVGHTESSGCFRLSNWNAESVLHAVAVGTPVEVNP